MCGPLPERPAWGDDSSENSSESGCYEVMDGHGEVVLMTRRLTCRVKSSFGWSSLVGPRPGSWDLPLCLRFTCRPGACANPYLLPYAVDLIYNANAINCYIEYWLNAKLNMGLLLLHIRAHLDSQVLHRVA